MKFRFIVMLLVLLPVAVRVSAQTSTPCPEAVECPTEEPVIEMPQIRLWNRSERDMENITVIFPEQEEDYADIPAGHTSDYRAVEPAYRYAYIHLTSAGEAYVWQPIDYVGETPLEPGYYTYALDIADDHMLTLELLQAVATVEAQGGRCVYGLCHVFVTLYSNGTFVSVVGPNEPVLHTVDEELMQSLTEAIEATDYEAIRSQPFTGICPVAYDGQELIYTFYQEAAVERLASCQYELDDELPLFTVLADILATQPIEE